MNSATFRSVLVCCSGIALSLPTSQSIADSRSQARTGDIAACDVSAYVNDPDPKGLNIRSGPGSTFQIIGNLLYVYDERDGPGGEVVVHITGASGPWVRIDRAMEHKPHVKEDQQRTLFSGEGWVHGTLLEVGGVGWDGGTKLYEEPTKKSRVVMWMGSDDAEVVRGCRGKWIYMEHKNVRGWAEDGQLCRNSEVPCN